MCLFTVAEYGTIKLADKTSLINWYKDINAAFRKAGIARAGMEL